MGVGGAVRGRCVGGFDPFAMIRLSRSKIQSTALSFNKANICMKEKVDSALIITDSLC